MNDVARKYIRNRTVQKKQETRKQWEETCCRILRYVLDAIVFSYIPVENSCLSAVSQSVLRKLTQIGALGGWATRQVIVFLPRWLPPPQHSMA